MVARQQVLVPGLLAVDFQLVDAYAAGVGPGAFHLSGEGEAFGQQGLGLLVGEVRGNPLGGPGLLLLGGLNQEEAVAVSPPSPHTVTVHW